MESTVVTDIRDAGMAELEQQLAAAREKIGVMSVGRRLSVPRRRADPIQSARPGRVVPGLVA